MKGTHLKPADEMRCVALKGNIGEFGTLCGIYDQRASCCRDFWPSLEDGVTTNEFCDKARVAHSLIPLTLGDWEESRKEPAPKNSSE
jgi:Fe-S-cluster containining protein